MGPGSALSAADVESIPAAEEDYRPHDPTAPIPFDKAAVTAIRFLSWKSYTRVMLDLSQEAKYEVRRLKEDSARGLPARVYVDIQGARVALTSKDPIPVEDGLLRQVRVGQYSQDVVRVVLDMTNLGAHNAFVLADPYRLVIDIYGQKAVETAAMKAPPAKAESPQRKPAMRVAKPAPATPDATGLRKIVLDPGHGGKDPGAIGSGGIAEKDIVLSIAKTRGQAQKGNGYSSCSDAQRRPLCGARRPHGHGQR
jgi:N-acetylmuramoyl-L-alanine amidase